MFQSNLKGVQGVADKQGAGSDVRDE